MERLTRLHNHLCHFYVRPLEAGHDPVRHQYLQLLVVQARQLRSTRSNTANTWAIGGPHLRRDHDTVDVIHCASSSRERSAGVRLAGASSSTPPVGGAAPHSRGQNQPPSVDVAVTG